MQVTGARAIPEVREELRRMGRWLIEYADRPDVVGTLAGTFEAADGARLGGPAPRPLTDPYAHVVVELMKRPYLVGACRWTATGAEVSLGGVEEAWGRVAGGGPRLSPEELKTLLIALGVIRRGPEIRWGAARA